VTSAVEPCVAALRDDRTERGCAARPVCLIRAAAPGSAMRLADGKHVAGGARGPALPAARAMVPGRSVARLPAQHRADCPRRVSQHREILRPGSLAGVVLASAFQGRRHAP
jgi:hypothetical protein